MLALILGLELSLFSTRYGVSKSLHTHTQQRQQRAVTVVIGVRGPETRVRGSGIAGAGLNGTATFLSISKQRLFMKKSERQECETGVDKL